MQSFRNTGKSSLPGSLILNFPFESGYAILDSKGTNYREARMMDTEKITVRIATEKDAPALLKIYEPYVLQTAITFEYEVPTLEEFTRRIRNTLQKYPYLVALRQGEICGYAYAGEFHARAAYDWAVETSIYVGLDYKRQGIGRRLYNALEKALGEQGILNLNACIAYPAGEDPYLTRDSVEFHKRLGYRMVGEFYQCGYKFHRWYNMVWMEKHIGEHLTQQPPVKPFPLIASSLGEKYGID